MNRISVLPDLNIKYRGGEHYSSIVDQIIDVFSLSINPDFISIFYRKVETENMQFLGGKSDLFIDRPSRTQAIDILLDYFEKHKGTHFNLWQIEEFDELEELNKLIDPSICSFGCGVIANQTKILGFVIIASKLKISEEPDYLLNSFKALTINAGDLLRKMGELTEYGQYLNQMQALSMIDIAVNGSTSLDTSLDLMLSQGKTIVGYDAAIITRFNPTCLHLEYAASIGIHSNNWDNYSIRIGDSLAGRAALERRIVGGIEEPVYPQNTYVNSIQEKKVNLQYHFAIPIEAKGILKGVLEVGYCDSQSFDDRWLTMLELFVGKIGVVIQDEEVKQENQKLTLEIDTAYDAICRSWMMETENYLGEPEGCTISLAEFAVQIGREFGLNVEDLTAIYRGVLLHDTGMLRVPKEIIYRSTPLDDQCRRHIQMHPLYAYDQLGKIERLRSALDIPLYHHERWDGSGYPFHFREEQIPLSARIFAVVDVWDAMRSDRNHRPGLSEKTIKAYLQNHAGILFDPQVVNKLFNIMQ